MFDLFGTCNYLLFMREFWPQGWQAYKINIDFLYYHLKMNVLYWIVPLNWVQLLNTVNNVTITRLWYRYRYSVSDWIVFSIRNVVWLWLIRKQKFNWDIWLLKETQCLYSDTETRGLVLFNKQRTVKMVLLITKSSFFLTWWYFI